ncbi:general substrate transporter [Leptodontidium sp. 2 PMI_412]|nr:general substrate transporter [Leptodontidium sp. 2 PMI_412]
MGKLPKLTNLFVVSGFITIGGLIQGFDVSSLSAIIGTHQAVTQGGVTASMAGGSLLGALFSSLVSDKYGRRDSLFIGSVVFVIGSALMAAVRNLQMLIVSRIVNGFAVGILTSQGPILLAEISLPKMRGRLITFQQWSITWGILIMYFISYGASFISSTASFRLPWGVQMIPAIVLMICVPLLPRSPRWLAGQDRWDEAIQTLADLHAKGNKMDPRVIAEVNEIREKLAWERENGNGSWSELAKLKNSIRVYSGVFTHVWAQLTGQNAMLYYIVYIFQMAGLGRDTLVIASIQYVIQVVMTVPSIFFMDRWPRRRVMMTGSSLLAIYLFTVAGLMASNGHAVPGGLNGNPTVTWVVTNKNASRAIVALSYIFVGTFALTWGPIGWAYPPEVVPFAIRSKAVSLATGANWAMNFSLTFFTPPGFKTIQWKVYCIFGTFCVASLVNVFLVFQETCGKSLEEVDDIFSKESIWAFKVDSNKPSRFEVEVQRVQTMIKEGAVVIQEEEVVS